MENSKPLVRWTIGPVSANGFECLARSIDKFRRLYDIEPIVCHNSIPSEEIDFLLSLGVRLYCQDTQADLSVRPMGVSWKLYPPRLTFDRHELFIDNDLVIEQHIPEIDQFFQGRKTLLLEGESRNYGAFDRHVPLNQNINSGVFGLPPGFDFKKHVDFLVQNWEENCNTSSKTFDEQGVVAAALLTEPHLIIPRTILTNCEVHYRPAAGMHFVGLNRSYFHQAYADYRASTVKLY